MVTPTDDSRRRALDRRGGLRLNRLSSPLSPMVTPADDSRQRALDRRGGLRSKPSVPAVVLYGDAGRRQPPTPTRPARELKV
ncbi:hypothetical protein EVAR_4066_1 [Eumeta japonica]|uniref:Uncharacterized protein n=1 Tax=Eumeta variegata TaxID=151549 RepID=A0A4C1T466_EUMVA|nr:hypothetical protein EVAR_4066_1 [Eumeta japonica]